MYLTYKYRLLTKSQDQQVLLDLLESQRQLYNSALAERRYAWKMAGRGLSYIDQQNELTNCRREFNDLWNTPANLQRGTLLRLDRAFKSFFRRVKSGQKPGYPRFKGLGQFDTLEWSEFSGIQFDGKHIKSKAFGKIRVHLHRPLPENPDIKTVKLVKDCKGWHVAFSVKVNTPEKRPVSNPIGLDLGLESFLSLSNGEKIPSLQAARKSERKLRIANRQLARCKRGSNRRQKVRKNLARVHNKIKNTRKTYAHQISSDLVKRFDLIAVEDLKIKNMVRSHFAKSINDAGWAQFLDFLEYKAEKAGTHFVKVNPRNTSQDCSECGVKVAKKLSDRYHICYNCGVVLDRDENAARNILNRAVLSPEELKVTGCGELALVNVN